MLSYSRFIRHSRRPLRRFKKSKFYKMKYVLPLLAALAFSGNACADTAIAVDNSGTYFQSTRPMLKNAKMDVLHYCKKESDAGGCKIVFLSKPKSYGYGAVATSKTGLGIMTGAGSSGEAAKVALNKCATHTNGNDVCTVVLVLEDSSNAPRLSSNHQANVSVGNNFHYIDHCVNGDCVRQFDGGRRVHFQASYCHNPFSGEWEWKPDRC